MPAHLKEPRLEGKAKKVIFSPTYRDPAGLAKQDKFANAINRIRTCILNGTPLPSTFYSKGAGIRPDAMLDRYGIMHLHLDGWNTDELLFLIQYPDHVIVLEVSDHKAFDARPPGSMMHRYHAVGIRQREVEIDALVAAGKTKRLTYGEKRRLGLIVTPKKPGGK